MMTPNEIYKTINTLIEELQEIKGLKAELLEHLEDRRTLLMGGSSKEEIDTLEVEIGSIEDAIDLLEEAHDALDEVR